MLQSSWSMVGSICTILDKEATLAKRQTEKKTFLKLFSCNFRGYGPLLWKNGFAGQSCSFDYNFFKELRLKHSFDHSGDEDSSDPKDRCQLVGSRLLGLSHGFPPVFPPEDHIPVTGRQSLNIPD